MSERPHGPAATARGVRESLIDPATGQPPTCYAFAKAARIKWEVLARAEDGKHRSHAASLEKIRLAAIVWKVLEGMRPKQRAAVWGGAMVTAAADGYHVKLNAGYKDGPMPISHAVACIMQQQQETTNAKATKSKRK